MGGVAIPQELVGGQYGAAGRGVLDQTGGEAGADGLPPKCVALPQSHQAALRVEILEEHAEAAAAAGGGFGVEAQDEGVEDGIVAAGAGGKVDLGEFVGGERAAGAWEPAGFGDAVGGAGAGFDQIVGDCPVVEGAGGGDDVFAGAAPVPAGAPGLCGGGRGARFGL